LHGHTVGWGYLEVLNKLFNVSDDSYDDRLFWTAANDAMKTGLFACELLIYIEWIGV